MSPVEKKVAEWDFGGALQEAQQIQVEVIMELRRRGMIKF